MTYQDEIFKQLLKKICLFLVQGGVVVANSVEGVGPFYSLFDGVGWVDVDALV